MSHRLNPISMREESITPPGKGNKLWIIVILKSSIILLRGIQNFYLLGLGHQTVQWNYSPTQARAMPSAVVSILTRERT